MGERLLLGSCAGLFLALDPADGTEVWRYDTSQDGTAAQFHGDPVVVGNVVYTGCDRSSRSHNYAFDLGSGELIWKSPGSALETDLIHVGGNIIGRRWNGDLLGLDMASGERAWSLPPLDYEYRFKYDCSPAATGDVVVVGGVDGILYAVDGHDGSVRWTWDSGSAFTSAVAIDGNDAFVGLASQDVVRVSLDEGRLLSRIHLEKTPMGQPLVAGERTFIMVGRGDLVAVARDLSAILWTRPGAPRFTTPRPMVWQGLVLVGKQDGTVLGFHEDTGEPGLEMALKGRVRSFGAGDDLLYVGTMQGTLFACLPDLLRNSATTTGN